MVVVGAGVIGIEYASMFAALGTKVTVVERRDRMLEFCDLEIVEALKYHLRDLAVTFRFGETVAVGRAARRAAPSPSWRAASGSPPTRSCTRPAGRAPPTSSTLEQAGLAADARGRIEVDEHFRTAVEHIYAVGDVIGFPALASTSMEQGRLAAHHACGEPVRAMHAAAADRHLHDPGDQLRRADRGRADRQRGSRSRSASPATASWPAARSSATRTACSSCWSSPGDRQLLGVHVFGTGATELVHIGQAVMGCGGTVDYLVDAVFNYPTLAESYKVAALDAMNKMRNIARLRS